MNSSIQDIYDHLCDGKKIKMSFPHPAALNSFKASLHQYRSAIAQTLESLGETTEKSTNELVAEQVAQHTANGEVDRIEITFKLVLKKTISYTYEILDE